MFLQSGYSGGARARYQAIDVNSQVEAASPHRLIAILFDEMMKAIDTMLAAQRAGNRTKMIERQSQVTLILLSLETSLDFQNGGDIAMHLRQIYREGRRLVTQGGRTGNPEMIEQARAMLGEIAEAWEQIG
jgi:flagellar protein FliS